MHCNQFYLLQWGSFDDSQHDVSLSLLQLCSTPLYDPLRLNEYRVYGPILENKQDSFLRSRPRRTLEFPYLLPGTRICSVLSVSLFTESAEQNCVLEHARSFRVNFCLLIHVTNITGPDPVSELLMDGPVKIGALSGWKSRTSHMLSDYQSTETLVKRSFRTFIPFSEVHLLLCTERSSFLALV